MPANPPESSLRWMHRYAVLCAIATFCLIVAGALVKSTGSGLAVPDWPLSFGQLMPEMVGGVFYEHGHRMVATAVGMLTVALMVWLRLREPRRWVRNLGTAALLIVVIQGCLGGMTVLLQLPPLVSIAHAGLAEVFFCVMAGLALFTSPWWRREPERLEVSSARGLQVQCGLLTAAVYAQIILGALVRHFGAGLSIDTFPLAWGRIVPDIDSFYVAIHFAHRVGAFVVSLLVLATAWRIWRHYSASPRRAWLPLVVPSALLVGIVAAQVLLGGYVIWWQRAVEMTTAHVATGALTLVVSFLTTLVAMRVLAAPAPSGHGAVEVAA